jgi:hypothetical protein
MMSERNSLMGGSDLNHRRRLQGAVIMALRADPSSSSSHGATTTTTATTAPRKIRHWNTCHYTYYNCWIERERRKNKVFPSTQLFFFLPIWKHQSSNWLCLSFIRFSPGPLLLAARSAPELRVCVCTRPSNLLTAFVIAENSQRASSSSSFDFS